MLSIFTTSLIIYPALPTFCSLMYTMPYWAITSSNPPIPQLTLSLIQPTYLQTHSSPTLPHSSHPPSNSLCKPPHHKHTRRFSNHESRLFSRSPTFAIIVISDLWKGILPQMTFDLTFVKIILCESTQGSLCPVPWKYISDHLKKKKNP